ncbi:hypothetical protein ScPMuIL_010785 [Solemya velum]
MYKEFNLGLVQGLQSGTCTRTLIWDLYKDFNLGLVQGIESGTCTSTLIWDLYKYFDLGHASEPNQNIVDKKQKRRSFLPAPKSYAKTQSQAAPITTVNETENVSESCELAIGDRVCIGGIKFGTLLYYGTTHITGGLWCGIELDDPEGRHDGQVEGVQYFHCRLGHGIFAPAERVALVEKQRPKTIPKPLSKRVVQESLSRKLLQNEESDFGSSDDVSSVGSATSQQSTTRLPRKNVHFSKKEKLEGDVKSSESKINICNKQIKVDEINSSDTDEDVKAKKSKPSRLPGFSRLPQIKKTEVPVTSDKEVLKDIQNTKEEPESENKTVIVEPKNKLVNQTFDIQSKTFSFPDNQALTDSGSSNDGSLSLDAKQCLASDGRQYLNLTFDTEAAEKEATEKSERSEHQEIQQESQVSETQSASPLCSQDSSLGLLNPELVKGNLGLLEHVDDVNLTDSEKILKATTKFSGNIRSERVASLNETFELGIGVTSTPLVDKPASSPEEGVDKSIQSLVNEVKRNLNKTFDPKQLIVLKKDEFQELCEDGNVEETDIVENKKLAATFCVTDAEVECQQGIVDGVGDHGNQLSVHTALQQEAENIAIVVEATKSENLLQAVVDKQKLPSKGPMIDSGISLRGEFDPVTESNMAESLTGKLEPHVKSDDMGKSVPAEVTGGGCVEHVETNMNFGQEEQLAADLLAGHEKKVRPLSLISTTSVDTGYVPDTDSEMGTMTVNSPTDWTDRPIVQGQTELKMGQAGIKDLPDLVEGSVPLESDSDLCSDAGTILATDPELEESDRDVTALEAIEWNMELEVPVLESDSSDFPLQGEEPDSKDTRIFTHFLEEGEIYGDPESTPEESQATTPTNVTSPSEPIMEGEDISVLGEQSVADYNISGITTLLQSEKGITDESIALVPSLSLDEEDDCQGEITEQKISVTGGAPVALLEGVSENENMETENSAAESSTVVKENMNIDEPCDTNQASSTPVTTEIQASEETESVENNCMNQTAGTSEEKKTNKLEEKTVKKDVSKLQGKVVAGKVKKSTKKKVLMPKSDHKKPNLSAPADDHSALENGKNKKNLKKSNSEHKKSVENNLSESGGKVIEVKSVEKKKFVKDIPKIIIKKSTPKSKWGNIMSQIEASKEDKPKPKVEVKSKIEVYLQSTPPPNPNANVSRRDSGAKKEKKITKKIQSSPIPNYNKVKSKLNLTSTPSAKQESSSADQKKNTEMKRKPLSRKSSGLVIGQLELSESRTSSQFSSVHSTGSRTDVSMDNTDSRPSSPMSWTKISNRTVSGMKSMSSRQRHNSIGSTISDLSQGSVKESAVTKTGNTGVANRQPKAPVSPATDSARKTRPKSTESASRTNVVLTNASARTNSAGGRGISKATPAKTPANQNKNKTTKNKTSQKPPARPTPAVEIARLEALCEARTKELTFSKLQLRSSQQAFDAMTVLVNYLSHDLDAFSCPELSSKLRTAGQQLEELHKQNEELRTLKQKLDNSLEEQAMKHENSLCQLNLEHSKALLSLRKSLSQQHCEDFDKGRHLVPHVHQYNIYSMKRVHSEYSQKISNIQASHQEEIKFLRNRQEAQMEELHKQHRDRLEDITQRFEGIKMGLSDKVESLRCECEELRTRARLCEDALQRDSDMKVQIALAPFISLPREIESLKTVIEMRNEEIQKLRMRNVEVEKQLEELPKAQEKIVALQQKLENVEAIVSIKTDHEKQLHEKCQRLMRKFEKESKTNKRLSMDYEELMWRMSQSSDFGSQENIARRQLSHSPPGSESTSPDVSRKYRSPVGSDLESSPSRVPIPGVVYRRSVSSTETSSSRRFKHRSATYIVDGNSHSPSRSPIPRRGSPVVDVSSSPTRNGDCGRMAHSMNDADLFGIPQGLPSPVEPPGLRSLSDSSDALIGVRIDQEISEEVPEGGKTAEGPSTLSDISESLQDNSESFSNEFGFDALSQDETGSSVNIGSSSDNSDVCNSPVRGNELKSGEQHVEISADVKGDNSNKTFDSRSADDICDRTEEVIEPELVVEALNGVASEIDSSDISHSQCQNIVGMTIETKLDVSSASQDRSHDSVSCDMTHDAVQQSDSSCDLNTNNPTTEMSGGGRSLLGETKELYLETSLVEEEVSASVGEEDNSVSVSDDPRACDAEDVHRQFELEESVGSGTDSSKPSYNPMDACNISSDQECDLAEDSRTKSILDSHSLVCSTDDTSDSVAMDTGMDEIFMLDLDTSSENDTDPNLLSSQSDDCKSSVEPATETLSQGPSHPVKKVYKESTV